MSTELVLIEIEITPETAPAVYQGKGLDQFFEKIKEATNEICDVTTAAGRKRIASQAFKISRSKTAVVAPGREYLKTIKALPKLIEQELREFENKCDALRDEKRKPLDIWEAGQKAIEDKRLADEQAAKDAAQLESDHEIGLLMDDAFNRDAADKRQAAEQAQRERDAALVQEAAEKAKADAEAKAQADKDASDKRERDALLAKERAEADLARAAQDLKNAEAKAAQDKIDAEKREAEAKEKAAQMAEENRLAELAASARREQAAAQLERDKQAAEVQRLADEKTAREADTAHKAKINRAAVAEMIEACKVGDSDLLVINEAQAKLILLAIFKGKVPNVSINY